MSLSDEFWKWFDKQRNGIPIREVERRGGAPHGRISSPYHRKKEPSALVCETIAQGLGIDPIEVFTRAGLLPAKITAPPKLPEPAPLPDDEHIMELFKILDPSRQRIVYDFTRWQLKEQLEPANSSGRRRDRQADDETIGLIDFMTAVERATPEEREEFSLFLNARLRRLDQQKDAAE